MALILFGTPETANDLAGEEGYQNITVARPLGPVDWDLLKYVHNDIKSSDVSGDCILASASLLITHSEIILKSNLTIFVI